MYARMTAIVMPQHLLPFLIAWLLIGYIGSRGSRRLGLLPVTILRFPIVGRRVLTRQKLLLVHGGILTLAVSDLIWWCYCLTRSMSSSQLGPEL